jgi:hypothetical protein
MPTNSIEVIYCRVLKMNATRLRGAQRGDAEHSLFVRKSCPGMSVIECVADIDVYTVEKKWGVYNIYILKRGM